MVGKYTDLSDAYLSVIKALQHACIAANRRLQIDWVEASHLEEQTKADDPAAHEGESRLVTLSQQCRGVQVFYGR
jgi:CTP synthase